MKMRNYITNAERLYKPIIVATALRLGLTPEEYMSMYMSNIENHVHIIKEAYRKPETFMEKLKRWFSW